MSSHERKLDAAEYVIGTLSQVESTAFEASIESDSKTRQDVLFWQRTFGSLSASISPEAPPEDMWKRISSALPADPKAAEAKKAEQSAKGALKPDAGPVAAAAAANDNAVLKLRRSRRRWRFGAIAASIVAIGLGSIFYNGTNGTFEERVAQIRTFGTGEGKAAGGMVAGDGKQYIAVLMPMAINPPWSSILTPQPDWFQCAALVLNVPTARAWNCGMCRRARRPYRSDWWVKVGST